MSTAAEVDASAGFPHTPENELRRAVEHTARRATETGVTRWIVVREELDRGDGLAWLANSGAEDCFYWERPQKSRSIAAVGCVQAIETHGERRFSAAARAARELFERVDVAGPPAPDEAGPLLVGGFAFAPHAPPSREWAGFPSGRLVFPELLVCRVGDQQWCNLAAEVPPRADANATYLALSARLAALRASPATFTQPVTNHPGEPSEFRARPDRSHAEYRAQVRAALSTIAAGELEKVVVARSIELSHRPGFDPVRVVDALRRSHPACTIFAVVRADRAFVGATPERLVRLKGDRLDTTAVAGSAPRGRSPEEDARLARELLESKKEQAEHATVVRELRELLSPCCRELESPEAPRLMKLNGIQHLESPIAGRLVEAESVLEIVGRLHPTSSVAGSPRRAALSWLQREEQLERGWYAGPVGFVDRRGGGEFVVALRSALLCPETARLFAGAGIVEGSEAEAELRETRIKLGAMLEPLFEI